MNKVLLIWFVFLIFGIFFLEVMGGNFIPHYLLSSASIFVLLGFEIWKRKIPLQVFLLASFLLYPGLAFAYAWVFGADYIKIFNLDIQKDLFIMNKAAFIFAFVTFVSYFLLLNLMKIQGKHRLSEYENSRTVVLASGKFVYVYLISFILFGFLSIRGEANLLSHSYGEVAGLGQVSSMLTGLWMLFFVLSGECKKSSNQTVLFYACFAVVAIWLLLHGKRAPLLGAAFYFIYSSQAVIKRKMGKKSVAIAGVTLLLLFLGGELRKYAFVDLTFDQAMSELSSESSEGIVELPGNGAGVYMSYLGVIYLFEDTIEHGYGSFLLKEMAGIVPDQVGSYFGFSEYRGFGYEVYDAYLSYLGGMHVYSITYADFGFVGCMVISLFLSILISHIVSMNNLVQSSSRLFSSFVVVFWPVSVWYNPVIALSWVIYAILLYSGLKFIRNVFR